MTAPDPRLVEVLKVWYSVFCTLVDAHNEGEYTDVELAEKMRKLRLELVKRLPEVEQMLKAN